MLDHYLSKRYIQMDDKGYFLLKVDREKFVLRLTYHSCIVNEKGEFLDVEGNLLTCHGNESRPEPVEVWECRTAKQLTTAVLEHWEPAKELISIGHAGYLGREAQKAEDALYRGLKYQQD
jgi:hypothetical protein